MDFIGRKLGMYAAINERLRTMGRIPVGVATPP